MLTTIENNLLNDYDKINASIIARRMIEKHGYWISMYHCMTLMIHCRKKKQNWDEEERLAISFWWTVRDFVYRSK